MPPCKKKKEKKRKPLKKKRPIVNNAIPPSPHAAPGLGNLLTEPLSDTNDDNNNNDYCHQGENLDVYFSSL